jgi:hypothetical protein
MGMGMLSSKTVSVEVMALMEYFRRYIGFHLCQHCPRITDIGVVQATIGCGLSPTIPDYLAILIVHDNSIQNLVARVHPVAIIKLDKAISHSEPSLLARVVKDDMYAVLELLEIARHQGRQRRDFIPVLEVVLACVVGGGGDNGAHGGDAEGGGEEGDDFFDVVRVECGEVSLVALRPDMGKGYPGHPWVCTCG